MPFLTRNPSHYLPLLAEDTTDPLHVGLRLDPPAARRGTDGPAAVPDESDWAALASALRTTQRPLRCLWLHAREGHDDAVRAILHPLGRGLVGAPKVDSLVLEGQGIGPEEVACLREYLASNTTLRGIKFAKTRVDAPSLVALREFWEGDPSLRVVDLTSNAGVDDAAIKAILGGVRRNAGCRLETLAVMEATEGDAGAGLGITEGGVAYVASFVAQTPSLTTLRLRIIELSDAGLEGLCEALQQDGCKIARLEIGGRFGDEGMRSLAAALRTNTSLRTLDIGPSHSLTDLGARALLGAVRGLDASWTSRISSNCTLQRIYFSQQTASFLSQDLVTALQSITTVDPLPTLQNKAWEYVEGHAEDLTTIGLDAKLAPHLLAFISARGGASSVYRFLHSWANLQSGLLGNPTPEHARLAPQIEKVTRDNAVLRAMLNSEREVARSVHQENLRLRELDEKGDIYEEELQRKAVARCLLLPFVKAFEMCQMLIDMLAETPQERNN